jgi:GT2 family glycosyltransferase
LGDNLELILVDNNSNDRNELDGIIENFRDLDIRLIENPVNGGYGQGNNIGVKASNSPCFVVINPDVRLVEPVFGKLIEWMDNNPEMGMAGVSFIDLSSPLYLKPEYYSLFKLIFVDRMVKSGLYKFNEMYLQGSFLFFRKVAFIEAGMFDENIFLYYEEADIANRILKNNYLIYWHKNIRVIHLAHDRPYNPKLLQIQVDSMDFYLEKYKINKRKIFKRLKLYYQLKKIVALLIKNEGKVEYFGGWITLINQKLLKY